jgi:hypothetical protein|tara:strand:+ start:104 stop:325 length:222 start_codon:yes stop_codon:yes gene_type:complete
MTVHMCEDRSVYNCQSWSESMESEKTPIEIRGDTAFVLCVECRKEWIDTDAVWIGEPRGSRCEKCVPNINGEY